MSAINIEIKARCFHPEKVEAFLLNAGARFIGTDHQKDTYFTVPTGRLKLRQGSIENNLIFYQRPDGEGPKTSEFFLSPVQSGPSLEALLMAALPVKVIVEKWRKIFFIAHTKFHIDEVPSLGAFVEIEVSNLHHSHLTRESMEADCAYYMQALEIKEEHLIANSYSDMLLAQLESTT
ncbi:MAG: class IV adenylate cyclase [Sediminibacterium sp.]|nr:class IV adenylate cyclase [Sediminibacterium sp.]